MTDKPRKKFVSTPQKTALPRGNPNLLGPKWAKGQSGNPNGRPKGSRNKLGEAFVADMLAAWEEHGKDAIERVIKLRPHEFVKAVVQILPREVSITTTAVQELSDDDLAAALAALRSATALADAGSGNETPSRH